MPVEIKWLIEERVIFEKFTGDLSMEDIAESVSIIQNLIESVDDEDIPLIHILSDLSKAGSMPHNLGELSKILKPVMQIEKFGWVIIYGNNNRIMNFMGSMVAKLIKVRYRMIEDKDEAIEFLQYVDSTLPDLKPLVLE